MKYSIPLVRAVRGSPGNVDRATTVRRREGREKLPEGGNRRKKKKEKRKEKKKKKKNEISGPRVMT